MSRRIEEILAVLEEIKKDYTKGIDITKSRNDAIEKVAKKFEVDENTIRSKIVHPSNLGLRMDEFDKLVEEWLNNGNLQPLMQKLLEHADNKDRKRIHEFFKDFEYEKQLRTGTIGIVANIAWAHNRWRGFDRLDDKIREKYGFEYVKQTGFAHEWWNFYEDFDSEYYYGHVESRGKLSKFNNGGLVIFVSRNVDDNNFYFVGFYGDAEYSESGFRTGKILRDLLPTEFKETLKNSIETGRISGKHADYLRTILFESPEEVTSKFRARKVHSAVFLEEGYVQISSADLGIKKFGQNKVIYIGENESIKPEKIFNLLLKAKHRHEDILRTLKHDDVKREEVQSIIEKVDWVLKTHFRGGYFMNVNALKQIIREEKEKWQREWDDLKHIIFEKLGEISNTLLQKELTKSDIEKLRNLCDEIPQKQMYQFWFPQDLNYAVKIFNNSLFKNLLEVAKHTNAENLEKNLEKIKEVLTKIRENQDIKNVGIATCSTWMAVVNPKFFMPINSNTLSDETLEEINFRRVVGGNWDIDGFVDFIKAINNVKKELDIETATEIAYYLSKYRGSTTLKNYLTSKGYHFPDHLIAQFYTALKTKGFVILSGLSGTGKTKVAQELAELLGNENRNHIFLSVRPDWRDSKSLIGYYNPLTGEYHRTELLDLILRAKKEYELAVDILNGKRNVWFIKCGEGGRYSEIAFRRGYISLEWETVPDLRKLPKEERDKILDREDTHKPVQQLRPFFYDISIGDLIIMPLENTNVVKDNYYVAIGIVKSEYYYVERPSDGNPQQHRRRVEWIKDTILKFDANPIGWTLHKLKLSEGFLTIKTVAEVLLQPYFIILDEMNLAHVEYYFADFLSVLESGRDESGFTRESIKLHNDDAIEKLQGIPKELKLPPNLYIIGTVNIDETTYMFSPKVLDRAFTIELHDVKLEKYPPEKIELTWEEVKKLKNDILNDLRRDGRFLAVYKKGKNNQEKSDIEEALGELKNANNGKYWQILQQLNKALEPYDLHFGYRVVDEIALFFRNAKESQEKGIVSFQGEDEIFDLVLLMKILPKFHGNRKKLEEPLKEILKFCIKQDTKTNAIKEFTVTFTENKQEKNMTLPKDINNLNSKAIIAMLTTWENYKNKPGYAEHFRFKHTAKKVLRMLRQLYEIGFASFS